MKKQSAQLVASILFTLSFAFYSNAQNIGINKSGAKPSNAAVLDLNTGNAGLNLGFLPPHVSLRATNTAAPVTLPDTGLIVYNTAIINDVVNGYYYWNGSTWNLLATSSSIGAGTANYLARWISPTQLGTGATTDDGTNVGIGGVPSAGNKLYVNQTSASDTGIVGINSATFGSGTGIGVMGSTAQEARYGVYGTSTNVNGVALGGIIPVAPGFGFGTGVYGQTGASFGTGILGTNLNSAGVAIFGVNNTSGTDIGTGVLGKTSQSAGYGVNGANANADGVGVYGANTAPYLSNFNNGIGVLGTSLQYFGYGLEGIDSNGNGVRGYSRIGDGVIGETANDYGVIGITSSPNGFSAGVFGFSGAPYSNGNAIGVYGYTAQQSGYGVKAANANSQGIALYGRNTAINGGDKGIGVFGESSQLDGFGVEGFDTTGTGVGGFVDATNATAGIFANYKSGIYDQFAVSTFGQISNGSKSTVVPDKNNKQKLMFCAEAPEVLFEDYGSATLVNGKVHINLDSIYAMNVAIDDKHPLRVLITLEGDCKGVYVTNKTSTGFDVIELQGGNSNVKFTYEVVANRINKTLADGTIAQYSDMRFPDAPAPPKLVLIANSNQQVPTIKTQTKQTQPRIIPAPHVFSTANSTGVSVPEKK